MKGVLALRAKGKKWGTQPSRWPMMRSRRASGASASILAAYAAALPLLPAIAKTPGEVHCYKDVCHRVKSLEEMRSLVGREVEQHASFYDIAERDRMNTATLTSSGEAFDAWSDSHAASSLYPDGTELLLWNPANGRTSHVRVNDFGPFYKRRTIDVTRGVAEKLDFARLGVTTLKIIVIWAPDPRSARYRRQRIYAPVEGFLGRFDYDQLIPLKNRLIAQAPVRNGQPVEPLVAAVSGLPQAVTDARQAPKAEQARGTEVSSALEFVDHSLDDLPAFAHPRGDDAVLASADAELLNTPRFRLSATPPVTPMVVASGPITFARNVSPTILITATSPAAIAAASLAPGAILARDYEISLAVASLELTVPAVPAATRITVIEALRGVVPAPNSPAWQHLLLTLGLLSAAAASWRTRQILASPLRIRASHTKLGHTKLGRTQLAHTAARRDSSPHATTALSSTAPVDLNRAPDLFDPSAWSGVPSVPAAIANAAAHEPTVTLAYSNVITLPQLPQRAIAKSDDQLRAEAAEFLDAFAYRPAEMVLRQLLAQRERAHGLNHPLTASAERQLADCLRDQGSYASAEPYYRRALAGMTIAAGDMHPAVADVLDEYALCLLRQGRAADARGLARQALAVRRIAGAYTREYAVTLTIVAETNRAEGDLASAEAEHRDAWGRFVALSGQTGLDSAASMMSLGTVLAEAGHYQAAEQLLNASARTVTSACGPDHPASATVYAMLGDLYARAGQLDSAASMHGYAREIRDRILGPRHPDTIESHFALALIATDRFQIEQARELEARGLDGLALGERQQFGPQSRIRRQLVELARHHDTSATLAAAAE